MTEIGGFTAPTARQAFVSQWTQELVLLNGKQNLSFRAVLPIGVRTRASARESHASQESDCRVGNPLQAPA